MLAPVFEERFERPLLHGRQAVAIVVGRLEQDVEVPDGAETARDLAQAAPVALRPPGPEGVAEHPPRRPLATGRDAHRMQFLGIGPGACPGLAREHARQVEAHDLAAGLGDVVVGGHPGRLADRQRRLVGLGARGGLDGFVDDVG